ncbi:hypothetical protein MMB232_01163 [Brevundimonas subvibrioides]|uniref:O-antigen ligase family protein n=1 Tax=Brevundimonas subvibrioides TaxID=74313 RepID=UPI0032D58CD7
MIEPTLAAMGRPRRVPARRPLSSRVVGMRKSIDAATVRDVTYAVAALSLLFGNVIGGKAALFSLMALVVLALDHRMIIARLAGLRTALFIPLILFLIVHLGSAASVGQETLGILTVQILTVAAFALPFYLRYSRDPMHGFNRAFGIGVIAIVALIAVWHLGNGRPVGWKLLGETKGALSLLPIVMLAVVTAQSRRLSGMTIALLVLGTLAILLSGERKAYQGLAIAALLMVNLRNPVVILGSVAALALVPLAISLDPTGYVGMQVDSLLDLGRGEVAQTLSNRMREWQFDYVMQLFAEKPVFGIGTRHYVEVSMQQFGASEVDYIVPSLSIHGEALRVLAENGVVGFSVWVVFIGSAIVAALWPRRQGRRRSMRELKIVFCLLVSLLLFIGFEAFDTTMMLVYFMLPLLGSLRIDEGHAQPARPPVRRAASRAGQSGLVQGRSIST